MAESESPLIQALPPKTDYLTYLTIVEYNLTPESLPVLHTVLRDETLTINIGWDLVHLLVPHLPDSEQCLKDIAYLGNPREVILKVTESLRLIAYEDNDDHAAQKTEPDQQDVRSQAESSTYPLKTAAIGDGSKRSSQAVELPPPLPLSVSQFIALLSMLAILHPRIKAKYPSRFLSTTLQAILASFSNATTHREEMIEAIVKLVKSISNIQRPTLPSRRSSGAVSVKANLGMRSRADPEGSKDIEASAEEGAMQRKLFQSFVTHVTEEYMLNLPRYDELPGMAWCSRIMEKVHPERQIPDISTMASRFASEENLQRRIDAIGQLATLARDLSVDDEDLLEAAISVEKVFAQHGDEEEPPATADDIPLSRMGSLLLYAARQAAATLYDTSLPRGPPFALFPDHQDLIKNCLASPEMGAGQLGTEPVTLIDAVIALGLICLENDSIGAPASDEDFNEYLQVIAFLSSNCPNSNLRGHAHYLATTVLRSQPDDKVRLDYIRDTLEHCPFENLKVSAVGWIKGETIEANPPSPSSAHDHQDGSGHSAKNEDKSIFATPLALDSLGPYLFPSVQADIVTAPVQDAWVEFQANLSFYLASLNFLYLLLTAKHVHQPLDIEDLWSNNDIGASFLQPLRDALKRFSAELRNGGSLASEGSDSVDAELTLLDETLARVTKAATTLVHSV